MKTDDLIALLADDPGPVPRNAIEQRFAVASLAGLACALVLMLALFGITLVAYGRLMRRVSA